MQESIIKTKKQLSQNIVQFTSPQSFKVLKPVSLLDILEDNPDPKYFLSEAQIQRLIPNMRVQPLTQTTGKVLTTMDRGQQSQNSNM